MKPITKELKNKLNKSHSGIEKVSWDMIYDTEEELINDLFNEKIYTDEDNIPYYKVCKGYVYIKVFRNYYNKNGKLTNNQLVQLKRLASEIAYHIYCE